MEFCLENPLFNLSAHTVNDTGGTSASNANPTLELGSKLKQVLVLYGMSNMDAETAWTQAKESASKTNRPGVWFLRGCD